MAALLSRLHERLAPLTAASPVEQDESALPEPLGKHFASEDDEKVADELEVKAPSKVLQNAFQGIAAVLPRCQEPEDPKFCSKCRPIIKHVSQVLARSVPESTLAFQIWRIFNRFQIIRGDVVKYRHHRTLEKLREVGTGGCCLCRVFASDFCPEARYDHKPYELEDLEWSGRRGAYRTTINECRDPLELGWLGSRQFEADKPSQSERTDSSAVTMLAERGVWVNLSPADYQANLYYNYRNLGSTQNGLQLCQEWLRRCRLSHEACQHRSQYTPTRLISVENGTLKLVLASEVGMHPEYATLSHCWGKISMLTLTLENIASFRNQIPVEELSKLFQDAIQITRALELKYLWIDSLCIIQDSKEDWKSETTSMNRLYGDAVLNIAATSSPDGNTGCFFDRPVGWGCQLSVQKNGENEQKEWHDIWPSAWGVPKVNALETRGWAIVERLLSRRTLHFTDCQIFWECDQEPACESLPAGYPDNLLPRLSSTHIGDFGWMRKTLLSHENWREIVEGYSNSQHTEPRDRLVAIGSIAKQIHEQSGQDYLAGLWLNDFERQLLWFRHHGIGRVTGPYTAPTWSWASIEAKIWFQQDTGIRYAFFVPDNSRLPLNHFGALDWPISIRMRCDVLLSAKTSASAFVGFNAPYGLRVGELALSVMIYPDMEQLPEGTDGVDAQSVWLLLIEVSRSECRGLVLSSTGERQGEFKRLGQWTYQKSSRMDSLPVGEFVESVKEANAVEQRYEACFAEMKDVDGVCHCFIDLV